jgi:CheY-like chemotaxis protein
MGIPKILVIEHHQDMQKFYHVVLHKHGQILSALSMLEALHALVEHPDIDLIVVNSHIRGCADTDSVSLIEDIRRMGYTKPVIAASSDERTRQRMIKAGCTHEYGKAKNVLEIDPLVRDILQLPSGIYGSVPPAEEA